MKRIVVVLTLSMVFILAGCNNQTQDLPEVSKAPVQVTTTVTRPEESDIIPETTEEVIEQREGATFRNSIWGDDKETVKKYELDMSLKETTDGILGGETSIGGLKSYCYYYFNSNNKLYQGIYYLIPGFTSGGAYISGYNTLKSMLCEKYGEPIRDEIIPYEKQSLIDHAGSSKALEFGYVVYEAEWNTEDTNILISLGAQDYEEIFVIGYTDINYKPDINDSGL